MSEAEITRDASAPEPITEHQDRGSDAPPDFGLVDVIEAFTAMRHEWRGQTMEGRELTEAVRDTAQQIQGFQSALKQQVAQGDVQQARRLALTITELDSQLGRAVDVLSNWQDRRRLSQTAMIDSIHASFAQLNVVARWLAGPWMDRTTKLISDSVEADDSMIEGLRLVLSQLRRTMSEHQIEREDTEGKRFDPETMNAIGTIAESTHPPGHVVEQLLPVYRWQGNLLSHAQVRVAK